MDDLLPNCLTKQPKIDYQRGGGTWFYLFCANCGAEGGRVLDTYLPAQYAFYLCNYCAETYGEVAGCTKTPDDVFFAKVQAAMEERYGHVLNEQEILRELGDKSSVISQLEREGLQRR
jgi:hypothetical protein